MKSIVKLPVMLAVLGAVIVSTAGASFAQTVSSREQAVSSSDGSWVNYIRNRDAAEGN